MVHVVLIIMSLLENIGDALLFLSGTILLLVAIIFFRLYSRYKKRDHRLMGLAFMIASFQMVITEFDFFLPSLEESGVLDFIAGLFSFILALSIVFLLLSPERLSASFEEDLANQVVEE